jgi:two-component sensor histidine kinase
MQYIIILFLLFSNFSLYAIEVDEQSSNLSILEKSSIFIDKTNKLSKNEIINQIFVATKSNIVSLGYSKDTALWIKITLSNKSSKNINKILEYDNPEVEELLFYEGNSTLKLGLLHLNKNNLSVNPTIYLSLKAYESKTYYLKSHSKIKAIKAKLVLWNEIDFIKEESSRQMYRFVFFGIMLTLFIYNFMLFLFTKDKAYFYYICYLASIVFFNAFYSGMFSLYFPFQELSNFLLKANVSFGVIIVLFSLLFTQKFLETKKFRRLNKILNIILIALPIVTILSYDNWIISSKSLNILILFGLFIIYIGFYSLFKGVKQAKFYVLGWSIVFIVLTLVGLQAFFHYDLQTYHLTYIPEGAFIVEALLFSIALAHRIEVTKEANLLADNKLINFQKEEKRRLKVLVIEKTKALSILLQEKEILYKELNHRIKNNFMMILSLLKLQIRRTKNSETMASLDVTKNRIESIANLYEMLLLNNESVNIDTALYIRGIYNNIMMSSSKKVKIDAQIQCELETNTLIYVGLIINELVTNSFKYAFDKDEGEINIQILKKEETVFLTLKDNGKGFKERGKNSLGLTIVEILVEGQLQGKLKIDSTNGTEVFIQWREKLS